jgi:hypothetical protein
MEYIKLFEEYNKDSRNKEISIEEAVNLYNQNCNDWDLNGKMIYRGSWTSPNIFYGHAGSKEHETRVSANSDNVYTSIFSLSESWKQAPDRSKSYIMSDDSEIANSFTDEETKPAHIMIPYNGTKFGYSKVTADIYGVPVIDILEYTNDKYYSLEKFDSEVMDFLSENMPNDELLKPGNHKMKMLRYPMTPQTLQTYCDEIDKVPKNELNIDCAWDPWGSNIRTNLFAKHWVETNPDSKLLDHLKMLLDFNKLEFGVTYKQSELKNKENSDRLSIELWSDGEFIGISENHWEEFKSLVSK